MVSSPHTRALRYITSRRPPKTAQKQNAVAPRPLLTVTHTRAHKPRLSCSKFNTFRLGSPWSPACHSRHRTRRPRFPSARARVDCIGGALAKLPTKQQCSTAPARASSSSLVLAHVAPLVLDVHRGAAGREGVPDYGLGQARIRLRLRVSARARARARGFGAARGYSARIFAQMSLSCLYLRSPCARDAARGGGAALLRRRGGTERRPNRAEVRRPTTRA